LFKQTILIAGLGLSLSWTGAARAGGFAVARYAGEHGHVAADNPTAIYFNPAGLAIGSGWRIYAEGLFALRHAEYDRPQAAISSIVEPGESGLGTPSDAISANAGTATLDNFVASPFLGVATDLGVRNLGLGLALHVPFGGQASWSQNDDWTGNPDHPGAVDGVQRWSTIEGSLRSIYVSLAGAYRLPGARLSFGAGVNLVRSSIETVRARTAAGTDDLVDASGNLVEGRSLVDTSGLDIAAAAGLMWEPVDRVWIGASYQSQPGFGSTRQSGTLTNKLGASRVQVGNIDLEQSLPDIARLGVRIRTGAVEIRASGDYQRWSVFDKQCLLDAADAMSNCALDDTGGATAAASGIIVNIPRNWNDTFGVRAGASYWITPAVEINGGAVYDSSAVPDETIDAALLDQDKVIALVGARFALLQDQLLLGVSANNVFYIERTVAPRDPDAIGTIPPSTVPDGAGTYSQNVLYFNANAEYRF
jgi:long-chain fatty acid transport protein